jgi:hypothetical protein
MQSKLKQRCFRIALSTALAVLAAGQLLAAEDGFERGAPKILSMSVLEFGPDGTLFVGDSKSGAVWAIRLDGEEPRGEVEKPMRIMDLEGKLGAMMGSAPAEVMIHDLAVHPLSKNQFLAVSRGRKAWKSNWEMPNDVADASLLVRISPTGEISDVSLDDVAFQRADLPNPVDFEKAHRWKEGVALRADAITDMALSDGTLLVAGLSNEEFASTLWRIPFPFGGETEGTTLEIYHGAHGAFETNAPIRAFLPYSLGEDQYVVASYLCTPLVTFPMEELAAGSHVQGRTVAEFGSGNAPLDMILVRVGDRDKILMSNTSLPLLSFNPEDLSRHPAITDEVKTYTYGVPYVPMAGSGVQHIDNYGNTLVAMLQRTPSGRLDLTAMPVGRLR